MNCECFDARVFIVIVRKGLIVIGPVWQHRARLFQNFLVRNRLIDRAAPGISWYDL